MDIKPINTKHSEFWRNAFSLKKALDEKDVDTRDVVEKYKKSLNNQLENHTIADLFSIHNELYSNNRFFCCVFITNSICIDFGRFITFTIFNNGRISDTGNHIRKHLGPKNDGKNIKPVNISDFNKLGILGRIMGHRRNVFQCTNLGGNIYHHRTI